MNTAREWAVRNERDRLDSATRASLLDAAKLTFEQLGYARTTIAGITLCAEVSRATFYVYFASKSEVFRVLAERLRDSFLHAQEAHGVDPTDPVAVAEATTGDFLAVYADNLAFITVLEHQALSDEHIRTLWSDIRTRLLKRATRYVQRLVRDGLARPSAPADIVATAASGMITRFAPMVVADPGSRERIVGHLVVLYLRLLGIEHDPDTDTREADR
ncbi:AcrR family transcriptional regulator [Saccharopolyspora lacisalsi]|uniref:AcrR family transcriptional regulator n=1 Tax=Halosaccharopolyspora lacisalsi TaxID=1000566 RepID=A0A839DU71_9PSEU|nr:TetR/AcrR family transcriptional regulator [Halosaccharopolyspora lacisalsi]MBA8824593.1 AcrR family transcriptional regulator [Halosaccharopolyspora lacisalsi]